MNILIVRSHDENNVCVRLQSAAIVRGLASRNDIKCSTFITTSNSNLANFPYDVICFHYNDIEAIQFIRARIILLNKIIICFGSDIHEFKDYLALYDIVDAFIVPTKLHRKILGSQLETPIYVLSEPMDPLVNKSLTSTIFPIRDSRRLCWFGYAESYYKGMLSLQPIIDSEVANGTILDYTLITNIDKFPNDWNLNTLAFHSDSFISTIKNFDYAILSHFALDLNVNTLIKSPNKAITSLIAGVIPIASNTPAYEELFSNLGLERFLFESPSDLRRIFKTLDPIVDSISIRNSGAIDFIRNSMSDVNTASAFIKIIDDYNINKNNSLKEIYFNQSSFREFSLNRAKLSQRFKRFIGKFK